MIVAVESGVTASRCRCTTSSSMAAPAVVQLLHTARVELPQLPQPGETVDDGGDRHRVVLVLDDRGRALGVVEHPETLLGRGGRVDRHHLGADRPQGEVEERPLVAGAGHDRDAVAEADALREEALGQGEDLVAELTGGHVPPLAPSSLRPRATWCGSSWACRNTTSARPPTGGANANGGLVNSRKPAPRFSWPHSAVKATPPDGGRGGGGKRVMVSSALVSAGKWAHMGKGRTEN